MKNSSKNILVIVALGFAAVCHAQPLPANDAAEKTQILESALEDVTAKSYDSARERYLRLIELTPDEEGKDKLRLERAELNIGAEKYGEAAKEITQILEKEGISPDQQWEARFIFYVMLVHNGKFDDARKELRAARAIEGLAAWRVKSADKFTATSYSREGRYQKAREGYLEVSDIDFKSLSPNEVGVFTSIHHDAQLGIAKSYFLEKNYAEATNVYERILKMSDLEGDARAEAQGKLKEIELLKQ